MKDLQKKISRQKRKKAAKNPTSHFSKKSSAQKSSVGFFVEDSMNRIT
jgi:hypothetical protein